jgi:hypothetical protein
LAAWQRALGGFRSPAISDGGDEAATRRTVKAGLKAAVEPPAPSRQVGAQEGEPAEAKPRDPQVVLGGKGVEGREQRPEACLCAPGQRGLDLDQHLQPEQRLARCELRLEAADFGAPGDELARRRPPPAPARAEQAGERVPVPVALGVVGARLAEQPPGEPATPSRGARQHVDRHGGSFALKRVELGERSGERLQRVRVEPDASERLPRAAREHQLGPRHLGVVPEGPGCALRFALQLGELDLVVEASRGEQQRPRPAGDLIVVAKLALLSGRHEDAQPACRRVQPAAHRAAKARELGGEANDRLGRGIEALRSKRCEADPRSQSATGDQHPCEQQDGSGEQQPDHEEEMSEKRSW